MLHLQGTKQILKMNKVQSLKISSVSILNLLLAPQKLQKCKATSTISKTGVPSEQVTDTKLKPISLRRHTNQMEGICLLRTKTKMVEMNQPYSGQLMRIIKSSKIQYYLRLAEALRALLRHFLSHQIHTNQFSSKNSK